MDMASGDDGMASAAERLIHLRDPWPSRVVGGAPYISLAELPDPIDATATGGETFPLVGEAGEVLGHGVLDRDNDRLWVWPCAADETIGRGFFVARFKRALWLRQRLGLVAPESAYRLINGEGDGLAGLIVDVYAGHAVISGYTAAMRDLAARLADAIDADSRFASVTWKVHPPGETPTGRVPCELLKGTEPPRQLVVVEDGRRYEVHLLGGINTGFFPDMREVRRALVPWMAGKRVLNTFCYTGSFSVLAATEGAAAVTSVDFAAGVLHWTKTNFDLNDLPTNQNRYQFKRADVFDYLKAARRQDSRFDVIILDPPAATNVPGKRWFLKSDYDRLIAHALRILSPEGLLVVAASSQQSRPEGIESQIRAAAREAGRRLRLVATPTAGPDFPTQIIHPQSRHLKCFFLVAE